MRRRGSSLLCCQGGTKQRTGEHLSQSLESTQSGGGVRLTFSLQELCSDAPCRGHLPSSLVDVCQSCKWKEPGRVAWPRSPDQRVADPPSCVPRTRTASSSSVTSTFTSQLESSIPFGSTVWRARWPSPPWLCGCIAGPPPSGLRVSHALSWGGKESPLRPWFLSPELEVVLPQQGHPLLLCSPG